MQERRHSPYVRGYSLKLNDTEIEQCLRLLVMGTPRAEIAKTFNINVATLGRYLEREDIAERLKTLREIVKHTVLERATHAAVAGAFNVVDDAIKNGNARDLDAASRAVLNLEKATASASGEKQRVEINGSIDMAATADIRVIIAQLADYAREKEPDGPEMKALAE